MRIHRVFLIGLVVCSSALLASSQWLQYRASENAREIVGGSSKFHRPERETPALSLPVLSSETPLFVKWTTPMDPAGFRWIVFDKKNKYGLCDILYFDTNGNGRLDDDAPITGKQTNQYEVLFGKVPVLFQTPDGVVTYHLNVRFYSYNKESTYIYAYAGGWYEGQIEIAGQKQRCILLDYNVNGTFNDKSEDFDADRIVIGPDENKLEAYVGTYLEYKDAVYRPEIARDGAFIDVTPAPDVAYGTVRLPAGITAFSAAGLNGMYSRQVADGQVRLPEGQYRVYSWTMTRKDAKGIEWRMEASYPSEEGIFSVVKDTPLEMTRIGEPVFSHLSLYEDDESFSFNQQLQGQLGERISLYRSNRQAPAPKIHIRNKTGEYDRTFSLEYG
jgi:hypothetical protein